MHRLRQRSRSRSNCQPLQSSLQLKWLRGLMRSHLLFESSVLVCAVTAAVWSQILAGVESIAKGWAIAKHPSRRPGLR